MTITSRLSWFFMSMLTVVLCGFSVGIYWWADRYRNLEESHRATAALNALSNVMEMHRDGVEWESINRVLKFEDSSTPSRIVWIVADESGRMIDESAPSEFGHFYGKKASWYADEGLKYDSSVYENDWLIKRRWFRTPSNPSTPSTTEMQDNSAQQPSSLAVATNRFDDDDALNSPSGPHRHEIKYPKLSLTVGISLKPVREMLHLLRWTLIWLSVAIWLIALFASRFVCRRALWPLTQMATATRQIDASDLSRQRLPSVTTKDELQDLNQSFNQLLDRLQETFERQRRFTGDASHQLRTPLTAITGQIEVALRRERRAEDYRQVLVTVQQKSQHLVKLVESLLFLARNDAEAAKPELKRLELTTWLPEHLKTWSQHPRYQDLRLENSSNQPSQVRVQPALLAELLNILIDNAWKYSAPGKPIRVTLAKVSGQVEVSVEDQGCGIDPIELPNLFVPFFRSADVRRQGIEGVGLGLSIAKRLATLFNAELLASSTPGRGSSFILRFTDQPEFPG